MQQCSTSLVFDIPKFSCLFTTFCMTICSSFVEYESLVKIWQSIRFKNKTDEQFVLKYVVKYNLHVDKRPLKPLKRSKKSYFCFSGSVDFQWISSGLPWTTRLYKSDFQTDLPLEGTNNRAARYFATLFEVPFILYFILYMCRQTGSSSCPCSRCCFWSATTCCAVLHHPAFSPASHCITCSTNMQVYIFRAL